MRPALERIAEVAVGRLRQCDAIPTPAISALQRKGWLRIRPGACTALSTHNELRDPSTPDED